MTAHENLKMLLAASRGKNLFKPHHPRVVRSLIRFYKGVGNKVDLNLRYKRSNPIPREFIRLDPWEVEYLYMIANRAKTGILEIGRYKGGSTLLMALANADANIFSIDISPVDDDSLKKLLDDFDIGHNLEIIVGDSQQEKYSQISNIDVMFIDGDHSYEGCSNDLNNWWDTLNVGGHVIMHDCYYLNGVQDAALEFINKHDVELITSPYISRWHCRNSKGSLFHFVKV